MDKMPPRIIAIVGAPGSGKSFLVLKLAEYYQAEAFLEGEEDNFPKFILESFKETYSNLRIIKWFRNKLIKEIKEAQKAAQQGKMVILDTFWLSNECYFSIIENETEKAEATKLFFQDRENLPLPDLIIYLKASEKVIRKFMEQRKRSFENENSQSPQGAGYPLTAQGVFKVCDTSHLEISNPITASGGVQENKKLLIFCTESRGFLVSQTNERAVHQALEIEKEHERIFTPKDFKNLIIFPRESLDFNKKEDLSQITRIIDSF